jgi:hypothetical protein
MIVQITPLGHPEEKVTKLKRIFPHSFQVKFRAPLGNTLHGRGTRSLVLGQARRHQAQQKS